MPFINAAGFVASRTSVPSSTKAGLPEAYAAPLMGTTLSYEWQATRISNRVRENVTERNRLELEQVVRHRDAQSQFREALTNLKDRIASKAAARTGAAAPAEVFYRAS